MMIVPQLLLLLLLMKMITLSQIKLYACLLTGFAISLNFDLLVGL